MKKLKTLRISCLVLFSISMSHGQTYADIGTVPGRVMASEEKGKEAKGPGPEKLSVISVVERGKHGPIEFIVTITGDGKISDIKIGDNFEARISKINKRRFLRQFEGKDINDPISPGRDLDAVTGATISSSAAARAVRRALMIHSEK